VFRGTLPPPPLHLPVNHAVASSKTLHEFDFAGVKATCLSLDDTGVQMDAPSGESTLGTEGILGVGLADGQVKCFDTRTAGQVRFMIISSAICKV
jgi:hypothetical protein